jgi:ABC-2 type transport system permease protein
VWTVAAVELRRFLRDRSNIFFVFIFPLLLVMVIGTQFGEGAAQGRVAVAGASSTLRSTLVSELERTDLRVSIADEDDVREQLARGRADIGLILSEQAAADYRAGRDVTLSTLQGSSGSAPAVYQRVQGVARNLATRQGMVAALVGTGAGEDDARAALAQAQEGLTPPTVEVVDVDEIAQEFAGATGFAVGAAAETLLFVFLASLTGSVTLIQARRLGVMRRTMSAPLSTRQAISGQALGRLVIATFQGGYIMVGTALLFDVDWGNIAAAVAVLVTFALVAAGAAMVIGSVMDNESAAAGVGIGGGLVLAALGGCMLPLELFPDTLQTVAHVTPHAWAYEAFAEIQRHGGTISDVLPQLGVLAAMAAALLLAGAVLLRRSLERAI